MEYFKWSLLTVYSSVLCSFAFAGTLGKVSSTPPNQMGYFIGIGGSYNHGLLGSTVSGTLNATSGFDPLGVFVGTSQSVSHRANTFSPEAQVGYFRQFRESPWLWGLEFLYQYSHLNIKNQNSGAFINLTAPTTIGVANLLAVGSLHTQVNDTLMLPLFAGHSFTNSFIYLGIGPSLFHTTQNISNLNDTLSANYVGNMNHFSKSEWAWGGAAQAGIAYYVTPTWFLKLNYTCAFTGNYTRSQSVAFVPEVNNGLNSGTLIINSRENLITQEAALSINKVFSL